MWVQAASAGRRGRMLGNDSDGRDDPVAIRARTRIKALSEEQETLQARIAELEIESDAQEPEPEALEDVLLTLPDLTEALDGYRDDELAELFAAFDLRIRYDKRDHSAEVSVALIPELLEGLIEVEAVKAPETTRPATEAGQRSLSIAGAGFEQTSATAYRFVEMHALNS